MVTLCNFWSPQKRAPICNDGVPLLAARAQEQWRSKHRPRTTLYPLARQESRQDDVLRDLVADQKAKIKREVAVHGINRGQLLENYSLGGFHNVHVQLAMQEEFDLEADPEIKDKKRHLSDKKHINTKHLDHYKSPNFLVEVDAHVWSRDLKADTHPKDEKYTTTENHVKTSWLELNPMDGPLEDMIAAHTYSHNVRTNAATSLMDMHTSSMSMLRAIRNVPDTIAFRIGTDTLEKEPRTFCPTQRSGVNPKTLATMRKHYTRPEYFRTRSKGGLATVTVPETLTSEEIGIPAQPGFENGDTYQLVGVLLSNVHGVAEKLSYSGHLDDTSLQVVDAKGNPGVPWDLPPLLREYVPIAYEMAVRMVSAMITDTAIALTGAHAALALLALVNEGLPFLPEGSPLPHPRTLTVNALKMVEELKRAGGKAKHLRMLCAVVIDKGKEGAWSDWLLFYSSNLVETRPDAAAAFHKHLVLAHNARRNIAKVEDPDLPDPVGVLDNWLSYRADADDDVEVPELPPGPSEAEAGWVGGLASSPASVKSEPSDSDSEPDSTPADGAEPPHTHFLNQYFLSKPGVGVSPSGKEWYDDLPGVCEALAKHIPNLAPPLSSLQRLSNLMGTVDEATGRPIFVALMVFRMLCVHHRNSAEARTDPTVRSCMDMLKASLTKILEYNVHECLWSAFIETFLDGEVEPPRWVAAAIDGYGVQLTRANVDGGLYRHDAPRVGARPTISIAKARRLKNVLLRVPNVDGMVSALVEMGVTMLRYMRFTSCTDEFYAVKEKMVLQERKLRELCTPAWIAMEVAEILLSGEKRGAEWMRLWRPVLAKLEASELKVPQGKAACVWVLHVAEIQRAIHAHLELAPWSIESEMKKNDELRKEIIFLKQKLDAKALGAEASQSSDDKPGFAEANPNHFKDFADRARAKAIVYALYDHKAYFLGPWGGPDKGALWHEVECVQQMGAYDSCPIKAPPKKLVLGASPKGDRRTAILYYRRRSNMQLEDEAIDAMTTMITRNAEGGKGKALAKEMLDAFSYSVFLQRQLFNYGNRAMNRLDAMNTMHECSSIFHACATKDERVSMAWAFRNNITSIGAFEKLKNFSRSQLAKNKKAVSKTEKVEKRAAAQPPSPPAYTLSKAEERRLQREKERAVEEALAPEREKQAARVAAAEAAKAAALKAERDALREASAAKRDKAAAAAKAAAEAEDAKAAAAARAAARMADEAKAAAAAAKVANNARKKGATPVHSDEAERLLRLEQERDAAKKNAEWEQARLARLAADTAEYADAWEAERDRKAAAAAQHKAQKKAAEKARRVKAEAEAKAAAKAKAEAEAAAAAKAKAEQEEWAATWEAVARAQREEAKVAAEKRARAEAEAKAEAEAEAVRAVQRERLAEAEARAAEGMAVAKEAAAAAAAAERERERERVAATTAINPRTQGASGRGGRGRGRGRCTRGVHHLPS